MEQSTINKLNIGMEEKTQPVSHEKWDTSYLNFDEDSVSMTSNTSTVQSSYVRHRIQDHEMKKLEMIRDQIDPQHSQNNVVINFVLGADNSQNNSSPFTDVVNEILAQTKLPKKIKPSNTSIWNTIYTKMRRPKYFISLFVLILVFIGSIIGLNIILSENKAQSTDTTTSVVQMSTTTIADKTTTTSTVSTSTNKDTTQLITTETYPSTTEDVPSDPNLVIITRAEWSAKPMVGSKKQSTPVELVIFMQTYTDSCTSEEKCKLFIQDRQMKAYPDAQDIRENFLISSNGNVYEGRGFKKEGEHTDRVKTSYNRKTIGFSFIGNYTTFEPNEKMLNKTRDFLEASVVNGNLSSDYKIYHQQQLIGGTLEERLFNFTTKFDHWKSSPTIIRREEWGADLMSGRNYISRAIVPHVLISSTGGPSCNTKVSCIEMVKTMQVEEKVLFGDIAYNFILGGDDFIFEGRSFDVMGKHTKYEEYDSIGILFIGNYNENPPEPTLVSKLLNEFLPFAVSLAKLQPDYKIFAQRQCIENTTSPGDSFFEIMKLWPHFDPEKRPTICTIGCATG